MFTTKTIDTDNYMFVVREFIKSNWQAWEDFTQEHEADPDEIFQYIGGEPEE